MKRKTRFLVLVPGILFLLFIAFCNLLIGIYSSKFDYRLLSETPHQKVGLVLGTSKFYRSGKLNEYFSNRIMTAVLLYRAGKIDYILVSGDNSTNNYNEPLQMKKELMKFDIPEDRIILDFAGFRTLDSVIRSKEIFGQESFLIISQEFHAKRAVFIARKNGIKAFGYNAGDVTFWWGIRTKLREVLARVNVIIDIYLLHKEPHFLGETIKVG